MVGEQGFISNTKSVRTSTVNVRPERNAQPESNVQPQNVQVPTAQVANTQADRILNPHSEVKAATAEYQSSDRSSKRNPDQRIIIDDSSSDRNSDGRVYELRFWMGEGAAQADGFVRSTGHPCGEVAIARVTKMPAYSRNQPLQPERVLELSASGEVLQQWTIPVDSYPLAIQERFILIEANGEQLWIEPNGTIGGEDPGDLNSLPRPEAVTTRQLTEFGESAYAKAWKYVDLQTNHGRILAFEGVCS
jgi:hypothetical protein